jgi:5-methylcytosine-specific restriction endonuclease McrA
MDYSLYHPDWRDVIRPAILQRDNYSCRVCGIRHKSTVYKLASGAYMECDDFTAEWAKTAGKRVFKLSLQIAHIDHDKTNNAPDNLISLCPRHHAKMDADHKRFLRISYRTAVANSKAQSTSPYFEERSSALRDIITLVRELTHVKIDLQQAEQIFSITSNFYENVKN